MCSDVPVGGKLGKGAFQLLLRKIQGVVIDTLSRILESLEQQVHLAEIPETKVNLGIWSGCEKKAHPLPSSITMAPEGMDLTISAAHDVSTLISSFVR